ncbi:MAG: lipoprotein signal peptidase [Runella slithyformis]|nr:MAG: lipoprotein signal peptidase [Runella slithyformis]TAF97848.1 MAG: lipoprotein signal peptidase [Runella sp.]TAG21984.1 MAG: lipoprotein signal peptidase [Cytophagales bacterium]TAG38646.1 MAG: lipoprotein signal peptidase [Cytophagia bacterium]TAE96103.1 MAG: lipoprotein signal peptidase [Runella slithyformis]
MNQSKNPIRYFLFALLLIGFDQAFKLCVHHYMYQGFGGQIKLIGDWFKLYYVTNPGMAFGMQIDHVYGKLFLTLFRLVAMVFIAVYMIRLTKRGAPSGLLWAMSMILAGAIGNVIDSTFYGVFLNNAPYGSPTPWFHGQVIDMIFIDFWEGFVPDWIPLWGGQYYTTPIFNIADSCIFIGVCLILMFQGTFFPHLEKEEESEEEEYTTPSPTPNAPEADETAIESTPNLTSEDTDKPSELRQ